MAGLSLLQCFTASTHPLNGQDHGSPLSSSDEFDGAVSTLVHLSFGCGQARRDMSDEMVSSARSQCPWWTRWIVAVAVALLALRTVDIAFHVAEAGEGVGRQTGRRQSLSSPASSQCATPTTR